jgi:hypothetical protein
VLSVFMQMASPRRGIAQLRHLWVRDSQSHFSTTKMQMSTMS